MRVEEGIMRKVLIWIIGIIVVAGLVYGGVMYRERDLQGKIQQAHQDFSTALEEFEPGPELPKHFSLMSWEAQKAYLEKEVYPQRQARLDQAEAHLVTIGDMGGKVWDRKLSGDLKRYEMKAWDLLEAYNKAWENEKAIDKAYYSEDWKERQKLALERPKLLEDRETLEREAEKLWKATGL
jgi:hypothetical protein